MRRLLPVLAALSVIALCVTGLLSPQSASAEVNSSGEVYTTARYVVPIVFPVVGPTSLTDTFLACRSGCSRKHMGQDLMGPKMSPLVAAFDGVVTSLRRQTRPGGGNYVVISADHGPAAGWSAMYLHVNDDTPGTEDGRGTAQWAFPAGIEEGARVVAGQLIAWRGNSGDAEATAPHLHFELRHGWGWGGTVVNAFPSLIAARHLSAPLASGPHPDGSLVRAPDGGLFLLDGGRRRPVSPGVLAADGRSAGSAVPVGAPEAAGYPLGAPADLRDGAVVADPAGTLWLVTGGARVAVTLPDLAARGLAAPRVWPVAATDLARLPVAADLPAAGSYPGALVRVDGTPAVSWIGPDGTAHPVDPWAMRSWGWTWDDVAVVPAPDPGPAVGDPLGLRDGTLVQTDSHRVGVVSGRQLHRLRDAREVAAYRYGGLPRALVPDSAVADLPDTELAAP